MLDPELIEGLEEAVEESPDNRALHLHLVALLMANGLHDRALGHCQWIMLHEPDSMEALALAAGCAEGLGDDDRARRYRRVFDALQAADSAGV